MPISSARCSAYDRTPAGTSRRDVRLGCSSTGSASRDVPAGVLSYAEQRALEIGITIAGGADVVLLDEPTSGMSRSETEHVVGLIRQVTAGKTLLMVEHDMSVVFDLADRIAVLVYGEIIAHDTPERIRANAAVQEAYLGIPQGVA